MKNAFFGILGISILWAGVSIIVRHNNTEVIFEHPKIFEVYKTRLNDRPAIGIHFGESMDHYVELFFLLENINQNYTVLSNKRENWKEFNSRITLGSSRYANSSKYETRTQFSITNFDNPTKTLEFQYSGKLVNVNGLEEYQSVSANVLITGSDFSLMFNSIPGYSRDIIIPFF